METLSSATQSTVQQNYEIWRSKTHSLTWAVSHLCLRNSHYLKLEKWGDSSQENFTVPNMSLKPPSQRTRETNKWG